VTPAAAATPSGKAYAWGLNSYGQLGDGTRIESLKSVAIKLAPGVTATALAAGAYHSLAIGSDGQVYAWGYNGDGELGNTTTTDSSTPTAPSLPAGAIPLALGTGAEASHSLAIVSGAPTAAILSSFQVVHAGGAIRFHWRVASGGGIRGFFLTA